MADRFAFLTLFDRINLANCARLRAKANLFETGDSDRFNREYDTAKAWIDNATMRYGGMDFIR